MGRLSNPKVASNYTPFWSKTSVRSVVEIDLDWILIKQPLNRADNSVFMSLPTEQNDIIKELPRRLNGWPIESNRVAFVEIKSGGELE